VEVDGRERWERAAAREETKSAMLRTAGMRAPMLESQGRVEDGEGASSLSAPIAATVYRYQGEAWRVDSPLDLPGEAPTVVVVARDGGGSRGGGHGAKAARGGGGCGMRGVERGRGGFGMGCGGGGADCERDAGRGAAATAAEP
jgi:hypothetical protein